MAKIPAPKRGDFLAGINRARKEGYEQALKDVMAEIEPMHGVTDICDSDKWIDKHEVLALIVRKMKGSIK